ncbi:MAG: 2Fe-2S iron-sulfur cluster-binding protein [Candidatus Velthaea sp.]
MNVDSTPAPRSYRIRIMGADREINCAADQDILNAAVRAGHNWLKVGCRGGGCGVCRVIVRSGDYVAGKMAKQHVAAGENGERYALACRIYPVSDLILEPAPVGVKTAPSPLSEQRRISWQSKV